MQFNLFVAYFRKFPFFKGTCRIQYPRMIDNYLIFEASLGYSDSQNAKIRNSDNRSSNVLLTVFGFVVIHTHLFVTTKTYQENDFA